MNILIWGWDVHTSRYCETLLFAGHNITCTCENVEEECINFCLKYNLKFIDSKNISICIHVFDIIIITCAKSFLLSLVKKIVKYKYKGLIILEKPIANSLQEAEQIIRSLKNSNFFIAHTRLFQEKNNIFKEFNDIKWPNRSDTKMLKINTIINVLDFIFCQTGNENFIVSDITKKHNNTRFRLICENKGFNIILYDTDDENRKLNINGVEYNWPNYIVTIDGMMKKILDNQVDYKKNIDYSIKVLTLAEKNLKYEGD